MNLSMAWIIPSICLHSTILILILIKKETKKERIEENRCRFYVNEIHKFKSVISLTKFAFLFTFTKVSLEKNFSNIHARNEEETLHSKHVAYYMCIIEKKKLEKIFTFDFYFRNSVWMEQKWWKKNSINSICMIYLSLLDIFLVNFLLQ